jgi:zinc transport system substrate-binding protein
VQTGQLRVVTSFYPLYDFTQQVGGQYVSVTNVTPAGAEPHDYEPSPKVLADAQEAPVFIYNGGTMEPWTGGFLSDYRHVSVKASTGVQLQSAADEDNASQQIKDPHFWLDPVLAQQIVRNIRDGLSRADPAHASIYATRATAYIKKLQQLDQDFKTGLSSCSTRSIVTSHAAFGYLGKRYNLTVYSIAGMTPDEEPSAAKLAELAQTVTDQHIKYVFFESLVSPRLADTIATETGAKTIVFDPIEGLSNADQQAGKNYLSVQRQNLANLRTALACR